MWFGAGICTSGSIRVISETTVQDCHKQCSLDDLCKYVSLKPEYSSEPYVCMLWSAACSTRTRGLRLKDNLDTFVKVPFGAVGRVQAQREYQPTVTAPDATIAIASNATVNATVASNVTVNATSAPNITVNATSAPNVTVNEPHKPPTISQMWRKGDQAAPGFVWSDLGDFSTNGFDYRISLTESRQYTITTPVDAMYAVLATDSLTAPRLDHTLWDTTCSGVLRLNRDDATAAERDVYTVAAVVAAPRPPPPPPRCAKITTGNDHNNDGVIQVTQIDYGTGQPIGGQIGSRSDHTYSKGEVVLDKCFEQCAAIQVGSDDPK